MLNLKDKKVLMGIKHKEDKEIFNMFNVFHKAFIRLKQVERTRSLWSNPLSIYKPDPIKLQMIMFNESRKEQSRELKRSLEQIRSKLEEIKSVNIVW